MGAERGAGRGAATAVQAEVARACRELDLLGRSVLVAVSGGVDSVVLLDALAALRTETGMALAVGHVNHGLRGAEAEADQAFVREAAEARGLVFAVRRVEPHAAREAGTSRTRPTLQEAARILRREALLGMAEEAGADHVALAHHRDDQAETVLLRLFRGTGPEGLGGIAERSLGGRLVRPLLRVSRRALEAYAAEGGLAWREDASNRDPAYARNRLRLRLRELGDELAPGWERAVADLAEAQRRESEWLESELDAIAPRWIERAPEGGLRLPAEGWEALPEALARRLLRRAWHELGGGRDVSRRHLDRARVFLRTARVHAQLEWPGGLVLERDREGFWLGGRRGSAGTPEGREGSTS